MTNTVKLSTSLPSTVFSGFEKESIKRGVEPIMLIRDVIIDYACKHGLVSEIEAKDLALYRDLSDQAAKLAVEFVHANGFCEDIIFKTIVACENNKQWMLSYREYIGDKNEFAKGNPKKKNLNSNLGYRIKIAVNAQIQLTKTGTRKKQNVTGHIISSFSLLKPNA